jgi:glycosyltransferase involved in cell wall biosynthesis
MVEGIEVLEFEVGYSNSDSFVKRTAAFLTFAMRGVQVALTEPYDLIFSTSTPLTAGIPGICARWLRRKPFVFEVRDLWPELPKAMGVIRNPIVLWLMSALEWASYRSARSIIGLAPGIVDSIAKQGVDSERLAMVPNGCDFDVFSDRAGAWRPDGVQQDDFMAVFAGAHGLANGLDAVLNVAGELRLRNRPDVKIVLIGDGKLKRHLQRRAMSEGLSNVIFHDPVGKARLSGLFAATDLGLQILDNIPAFYYGTSPNKFFDYIAAGLPVLVNYPGWLSELVAEHACGYSVPPEDPGAFASALIVAADQRESLRLMGKRAMALARTRFDRTTLADQFVDWLERSAE